MKPATLNSDQLFEYFRQDRFANLCDIELLEAEAGHAKARLVIGEKHLNGGDVTHGGALFTLADFVIGVASNAHGELAFSINGNMNFLRSTGAGDVLTAEANERFLHKRLGNYEVRVTNQHGDLVATLEGSVYRKGIPLCPAKDAPESPDFEK